MCSIQLNGVVVAGVLGIEGIAGIAHVARLKSRGMGVGVLPLQLGINVVLNSLGKKNSEENRLWSRPLHSFCLV